MAQVPVQDNYATGGGSPEERDAMLLQNLDAELHEAARRKSFHEAEVERWDRIGRAASAALIELRSIRPVPETSSESFMEAHAPQPAQSMYAPGTVD